MANEELKAQLDELHDLLERSRIDNEDKNMIGHLMSEIVKTISDDEEPEDEPTLKDRLDEQAAKLDSNHPMLASTLRQVAQILGNMGI